MRHVFYKSSFSEYRLVEAAGTLTASGGKNRGGSDNLCVEKIGGVRT